MKELDNLVASAEKADAMASLMDGVNPHHILAIADAFRALEQRAALIAENAVCEVTDNYSRDGVNDEISVYLPVGTRLFTRPAPAVILNDAALRLMDDEKGNPKGFIAWYERNFALQPYKGSSHVSDCEKAWRAAMLCKIEEAK